MKKPLLSALAAFCLAGTLLQSATAAPAPGRGGGVGFFVGCCLGLRTGLAWNEGKDLSFRDWCPLLPWVGFVFSIWSGIDTANGVTNADLRTKYPGNFF